MSKYLFKCKKCMEEHRITCRYDARPKTIDCKCGGKMEYIITGVNVKTYFNGSHNLEYS